MTIKLVLTPLILKWLPIGIFLLFPLLPLPAWSQSNEIVALKPFPAYRSQKISKSNRLRVFKVGETALISPQRYGKWKKVLLTTKDGGATTGWVHIQQLKGRARIQAVKEEDVENYMDDLEFQLTDLDKEEEINKRQRSFQQAGGLGVSFHISHLRWGERTFSLSDETEWTVSEVTSTTYWPSVFVDLKVFSRSSFRFYVGYRSANFEGESTTNFIGTKQTSFFQTFLSLGLVFRQYDPQRKYWWGLGAEGAQGQKLVIAYDNTEIPVSDEDLPLFILFYGAAGYDHRLTDNLYLLPDVRLGTIYNQDPKIYFIEGVLSLGWKL